MVHERVQKSFGQSKSKKKHTPIVPPLNEEPVQADSQLSPKLKPSRIPSKEQRDAIRRKIFDSIRRSGENQAMRDGLINPAVRVQNTSDFGSTIGMPIQPKLTIGAPGDKYEQEADRVAAQVVNQINAPVAQHESQKLQREEMSVEEEELQMKPMVQLQAGDSGMTATPDLESSIQQARGGGQPLADNIRQPMEHAFGADFSGVKVHTDAQADQLNQSIQAKAFTTGQDVFFRQGEYQPLSRGGQELLAHELTHVVQQNGGEQHGSPSHRLELVHANDNRVQRILETYKGGRQLFVSTFDMVTEINRDRAAITVAATKDDTTGGHAEIYLEMFKNGDPVEYYIDMIGVNDSKALVRLKTHNAGGINARGKGGMTTYSISTANANEALIEADRLKKMGEDGKLLYNYYLSKMWNLNPLGTVTYMNCADFAEKVLGAAGVAVSSGLLSMPKTIAE